MAIKAIAFENFLSHEETEIAPDKGLTVITGTSDGGKSNIVRAITWAITGKPFGVNWTSWFTDEKATIRVGVEFDEGSWVSREKSKNTNQYQVSSIDSPLKALRANVPDEVHEITRMTSVNMQGQDDGYFMLSSSPGEVGRMFNEAVGLQIIDAMISESKKAVVVYDARHRAAQESLVSLQEQIAHYKYLDDIEPIMTALRDGWEDYQTQGEQIGWLKALILESATLGMKIRGDKELIQIVRPRLDDLKSLSRTLKRNLLKIDTLGTLVHSAVSLEAHWDELNDKLKMKRKVSGMKKKALKLKGEASELSRLENIVRQAEKLEVERDRLSERLSALKTQYLKLLETAQICPVCFSRIDAKTLSRVRGRI